MSYRIFVTGAGLAEEAQRHLQREGCVVQLGEPGDTSAGIALRLAEFHADALIVRGGAITAEVLDATPDLRAICKHGVGTDNIDVAAATARRIPVAFTPLANYESVAEHTLAMILALLRRVTIQDRRVRSGVFDKKGYDGVELRGKTLGLIGYGKSARRLAQLVAPFEADIIVYHPSQTKEILPDRVAKAQRAEDVFHAADILSLHCPLTHETRHLVDDHAIGLMKRGAYLVNTARGSLVSEPDLVQALRDGRLGGAALDVYDVEPPAPDDPLFALDNVVFSTHVAGTSDNSFTRMSMASADNILAILRGERLDSNSLVNGEIYC